MRKQANTLWCAARGLINNRIACNKDLDENQAHIIHDIYTLRNCRQNSNTANKAEIQMAKQLLEFQRVLICMSVCKVSRATHFHQAGASHPPTFHPPASTLLLINLGAHPLRRGYRQNFVFLLCSIFYCLLFSSLQFPVLDLDYPNWMCI